MAWAACDTKSIVAYKVHKIGLRSAVLRSGLLGLVTAALATTLCLLAGAVWFFVQARLGHVDIRAGFEPNLFLRRFGLPVSALVFVVTFGVAIWRLLKSQR